MKKIFFSLALVAGVGGLAQAQSMVGIKAGANLATIAGDDADLNNVYKPGLNLGVALQFGLDPKNFISFQPEMLYSMKGTRTETSNAKSKSTLHYLDIPVLLRMNADGPFFELGPQVGVLLAAKNELRSGSSSITSTNKDLYNIVDLGAVAGVGYQFSSGPSIGIRYNRDFTSLYKDIAGNKIKAYNSVFQFQLGYMLGR